MEWSNELALQLIDEYEKHPTLWDPKHELHFSRNQKIDAWHTISVNLKLDVHEIKQKVNSLLGSFRREKAKGKKSIGTGKGRHEIYISKWFAFQRMRFLLDKDEPRTTLHTQVEVDEGDHDGSESINNPQTNEDEESQVITESPIIELGPSPSQPSNSPPLPKKRQKKNNVDPRLEEAYQIMKSSLRTEAPSDKFTIYGQHISNKLKSYSKKTQIEVEHAINNILYHADKGFFDRSGLQTQFSNYPQVPTPPNDGDVISRSASFTSSYSLSATPTPTATLQNMLNMPDFIDL